MMNLYRINWKWRKLRLNIWKKRLQSELDAALSEYPLDIPVSLHVSWGPFYQGAAILARNVKKAKILVQIPYDQYVTKDEISVMESYQLSSRDLPYFILNHEIFHLLDVLPLKNKKAMAKKLRDHHEQAEQAASYRSLLFEQEADAFAYGCFREKRAKTCYTIGKAANA